MSLSKSEIESIKSKIKIKMNSKFFDFKNLQIIEKDDKLFFKFEDVSHSVFKNVVILSSGTVRDSSLFTKAEIYIRFLYNGRTSPVIGHNLCTLKITLN